jgi:oxalate decarboxylase
MTGFVLRLEPGAMHEPHWHANANEWHYVARGRTLVTLFAADKRLAVAELGVGGCGRGFRGLPRQGDHHRGDVTSGIS